LVEVLLGDLSQQGQCRDARVGEQYVDAALLLLHFGEQPVEVRGFETSPCTPVTCLPICVTASSSSICRRPVMKTCAPSAPSRRAAARPMPLFPRVMTATLPSSLFAMGLILCP